MKFLPIVVLLIISSCVSGPSRESEAKKGIREYLKSTLDDPDSYKPVDYIFDTSKKYTNGWRVEHYFSAKNKFGALEKDGMYFNLDSNFKVVSTEGLIEGAKFEQ